MKFAWSFILIFFSCLPSKYAQNLIPNSSFERTDDFVYSNPPDAFQYLNDWYVAAYDIQVPMNQITPDFFDDNHRWPISDPANFWNRDYGAFDGVAHVGIANFMLLEGYRPPEAIGCLLESTLETDEFYHFDIQVRNKGISSFDGNPLLCVSDEYKQIDILFDSDSIFILIDSEANDSYVDVDRTLTLNSDRLETEFKGAWHQLGSCFQATGGERFMTIAMSNGMFEVDPPCEINEEQFGVFHIYYYDIDDVHLTKLPKSISLKEQICINRNTKINIDLLADFPIMQQPIEYLWEDGTIDSIKFINTPGLYTIQASLDCTTIPIYLEIEATDCDPKVFVPNAFSPNYDGINDQLQTFIAVESPIVQYEFSIFDRWGNEIFKTKDIATFWDGSVRNKPLDAGVFTWLLEYTIDDLDNGLTSYKETGDVLLLN